MRPRLVDFFNESLNISFATYLLPTGTTMYVLAMLVVMYVYATRCNESGLSRYHALGTAIYAMIGGLIGARLFYLLETFQKTTENPRVILDVFGGTTSWGVYLGGLTGFVLYAFRNRLQILRYADVLAASLGLGPFIGRWSCFLHGCCYGTQTDVIWAVQYPVSSPVFWYQVKQGLVSQHAALSLPVHPLPVYLSLSALIVFIITTIVWNTFRTKPGMTFLIYWLLYCSLRFLLEFLRGNAVRWTSLQLDLGQIICLIVVVITGLLLPRYFLSAVQNE